MIPEFGMPTAHGGVWISDSNRIVSCATRSPVSRWKVLLADPAGIEFVLPDIRVTSFVETESGILILSIHRLTLRGA